MDCSLVVQEPRTVMCARYAWGTHRPGVDPRRNLPLSPMSPGDGGVSLSLLVPLMGKS